MLLKDIKNHLPLMALKYVTFYRRSQWWDRQRLEAYQDRMIVRLVRHAAEHVPYYRKLFDAVGLNPREFHGREDMARIPLLDKETFRQRTDEFVADNADAYHPTWSKTSGSTGTPLEYILDRGSKAHDGAVTLRSYAWAGFHPGMKLFSVKDHLKKWEYKYSFLGRVLNFDSNCISRESAVAIWQRINRLQPSTFRGYPFTLMMLHKYGVDAGVPMHGPKRIITTGESLPESLRERLEEAYGTEVFDYYGMTENTSMMTECECHTYHAIEDFSYHEFLDPELGAPVTHGRSEVVATNFYNYAMPLIRYRTKDFAWLRPESERCRCGRQFRSVEKIEGREEDYILTPEGVRLNLIETPLNAGKGIMVGQYVQDTPDHMYVNIVPGPDFIEASLVDVEADLRRLLGNTIEIDFHIVDELEHRGGKKTGKVPFIYSKMGKSLYLE